MIDFFDVGLWILDDSINSIVIIEISFYDKSYFFILVGWFYWIFINLRSKIMW